MVWSYARNRVTIIKHAIFLLKTRPKSTLPFYRYTSANKTSTAIGYVKFSPNRNIMFYVPSEGENILFL